MKTYAWIVYDQRMYHLVNPVKVFLSEEKAKEYCKGTCLHYKTVELVK